MGGWLHTEMVCVPKDGTNRAQRRVSSLWKTTLLVHTQYFVDGKGSLQAKKGRKNLEVGVQKKEYGTFEGLK